MAFLTSMFEAAPMVACIMTYYFNTGLSALLGISLGDTGVPCYGPTAVIHDVQLVVVHMASENLAYIG